MSVGIAIAVAGFVLVLVVAVWAWISREGGGDQHDLGTISGQWISEHRSQERQSDSR